MIKAISIAICFLFLVSCNRTEHTPKPKAYPRIEREAPVFVKYQNEYVAFSHPNNTRIEPMRTERNNDLINISYPQYGANIYCTYIPLDKVSLREVLDDNHRLAYAHAAKANGIDKTQFADEQHRTYGLLYEIRGNVATPIQFYVTDSTTSFFRGSLYYNEAVNIDSVAPITQFIKEDIMTLIESLEWTK